MPGYFTYPSITIAKMATNRNAKWMEDEVLKSCLVKYVKQSLHRSEILDFMIRDFPQYAWSLRSLDRRLRYFEIYYNNVNVGVADVMDAVREELGGLGKL